MSMGAIVQMLKAAEEAAGAVESFRPTASSVRRLIDEAEERAVLHGDSVKQSAQADVLMRKWLRFVLLLGESYEYKEGSAPSVELVKHFVTYCFVTRDNVSAIGRQVYALHRMMSLHDESA